MAMAKPTANVDHRASSVRTIIQMNSGEAAIRATVTRLAGVASAVGPNAGGASSPSGSAIALRGYASGMPVGRRSAICTRPP